MNNNPSVGSLGAGVWIVCLIIIVFYAWCGWKLYVKAGKPGWAALIPIYNYVVLLEIVGIIVIHNLSKVFGKGVGYTLGLIFLGFIFYPVLALGSATYTKPAGA